MERIKEGTVEEERLFKVRERSVARNSKEGREYRKKGCVRDELRSLREALKEREGIGEDRYKRKKYGRE